MPISQIVWTKSAETGLKDVYDYIFKQSPQNASKVINDILLAVEKTSTRASTYLADKWKKNNDGSYRAFEKHHIRISFKIENNIVIILRVRHTSRKPVAY